MLKNYENVYENVTFTRLNTYKKGNDWNSAIPDIQKSYNIFWLFLNNPHYSATLSETL